MTPHLKEKGSRQKRGIRNEWTTAAEQSYD